MSSPCVLSETQKELLRSLVPGLQARDGTVETQWTIAFFPARDMMRVLKGLSSEIWEAAWKGKVKRGDIEVFVKCNLFIERSEGSYILIEQAIINAVATELQSSASILTAANIEHKEWDFFISHANEDKDEVARPLAEILSNQDFKVWYDEFSLKLGDSLRRSIDRGLSRSKYGIVILSPNFFAKEWPQSELDGLFAREIAEREKIILPVWHNITRDNVAKYSPLLADRLAVPTSKGLATVVKSIMEVMPKNNSVSDVIKSPQFESAKWNRVATLFWLCHDLMELHRWLLSSISKEWIDIGLRQSTFHAEKLGLDMRIIDSLRNLREEATAVSEEDWTPQRRERFASEIKINFNALAQLAQQQQQIDDEFDPGPG